MTGLVDSWGPDLPKVESPDHDKLRVYGDMMFLAFRSERHGQMNTATLRTYLEPPIELDQFRIFRYDGVPRGMYTWAWLSQRAARRLVKGKPMTPEDWRSGDQLWIIDMIAPYRGMSASMTQFIMTPGNFTDHDFHFRRVSGPNQTRRIVNVSFRRAKLFQVYTDREFLKG